MNISRHLIATTLAACLSLSATARAGDLVTICEHLPFGQGTCTQLLQPADSGKDAAETIHALSGKEVSLSQRYVMGAGLQYLQTKITGKEFSSDCHEAAMALLKDFTGQAPDAAYVAEAMVTGLMGIAATWATTKHDYCRGAIAEYDSGREGATPEYLQHLQDVVFEQCTNVPDLAKSVALADEVNKHVAEKYAACGRR
ncbi:hypothetical protein LA345_40305 (plasmid) [Burkholderia vietnamiensis]|uniref:Uncharacterized protein n=1 Tax=Burkholderia vietnamiensis (strain G4 / LMG 22486) TaxID=269482 RepID=A4JU48_BURVG|nr:hypothetical protein Bcep1808_6914 [Burkholderia vietnamiensis G4]MCB4350037.1 hypothetical protein [Burkholderia vietnamiensis]